MKNNTISRLFFTSLVVCGSINMYAQTANTNTMKAIDSNKDIMRNERIPCPQKGGFSVKALSYYNFSSGLSASFTFLDSLGNQTSQTDYSYYFDNTSYFFAMKELYRSKNQHKALFRIEELRDSIGFRANLNDTSRTLICKNFKNCNGTMSKFRSVINNKASLYRKTGKTKMIQGFLCEELVFEDGQMSSIIWVTVKEDAWLNKIRQDLQYSLYNELTAYSSGIVMFSENYYKITKHKQRFEVTGIDKSTPNRVITDGLKLVGGL